MEAVAARVGGRLAGDIPELGVHVLSVSPDRAQEALASLRVESSVESVERDVVLTGLDTVPNDMLWSTQWGSRLVGAPRASDSTRGAAGIVIAVIDTGVDALHRDLFGATTSTLAAAVSYAAHRMPSSSPRPETATSTRRSSPPRTPR